MEQPAMITVGVTRRMNASAERVFDAWLDPDRIGGWMFGPNVRDEKVVRIEVDPRVGGRFSFVVLRNGAEIDHIGEYLAIERPRLLAFTWGIAPNPADGSRVTVEITPVGDECDVTVRHEIPREWADYAERTRQGWGTMLEALAATFG